MVEVLVEGVGRVDGLVFFRGVFAGVLEDDFGAAGVLGEEVCYVVGWEGDDVSRCQEREV